MDPVVAAKAAITGGKSPEALEEIFGAEIANLAKDLYDQEQEEITRKLEAARSEGEKHGRNRATRAIGSRKNPAKAFEEGLIKATCAFMYKYVTEHLTIEEMDDLYPGYQDACVRNKEGQVVARPNLHSWMMLRKHGEGHEYKGEDRSGMIKGTMGCKDPNSGLNLSLRADDLQESRK
tara:strand:- start:613 stop:1146 length:534 start_codon:yes stop_codon:yes gene_type:complete